MSNGNKFTKSQLEELGFRQNSQGEWSKEHLQDDHEKPSIAEHKPDESDEPFSEDEGEEERAKGFRFCLIVHSFRTNLIDPSNASIKQIEDCLTRPEGRKKYGIGVIPDDSAKFCDQPLFLQTKVKKGEEKTEIEVLAYKKLEL